MKALIWGAGAIGGTMGAYLARAGHDITLVDVVAEHVNIINEQGITIEGPIDTFSARLPAFTPENLSGTFETVILAVKAHHTEAATKQLEPFLAVDGCVVSAQNGLNETLIANIIGEAHTVGCFVNFGADYLAPGRIHYGGRGAVVVGELDGQKSERAQVLHQAFLDFDDAAILTTNIWGYLWSKLAYGAMLFATALTDASIADALAEPKYRDVFIALPKEVLRVALARDISPEPFNGFDPTAFLPESTREQAEQSLEAMVAFNRKSAKTHSGVWRDLAVRKRKTEIDVQLGLVLPLADEVNVPTPLLSRLIELIHTVEDGAEQGWQHLDDLQARLP